MDLKKLAVAPTKVELMTPGSGGVALGIDSIKIGVENAGGSSVTPTPDVTPISSPGVTPSSKPLTEMSYTINDVSVLTDSVSIDITKNQNTSDEDTVIAAAYNKDGVLIGSGFELLKLENGNSENITFNINTDGAEYVSVYVWDSVNGMRPLTEKVDCDLK